MSGETTRLGARIGEPVERLQRWWLLTGSRLAIAFGLTVGFFALLQVLHAVGVVGYTDSSTVSRMASGMTAGSFSLITLVLTINQLILSQELGTAGQVRSRLEGMLSFRERIESATGTAAAPARPAEMVTTLARSTAEAARALSVDVEDFDDDFRSEVDAYTDAVEREADRLVDDIEHDSTFAALVTTFDFDDQWYIHVGRRLYNPNADRLSESNRDRFEDLLELLKLFDVGRSHFETIYLRRELADLSRVILAVGVPAVIAALLINLIYGTAGVGVPRTTLPVVVSGLSTVVFAPVAILASYLLRAATVGFNNATVGPMVLGDATEYDLGDEVVDDEADLDSDDGPPTEGR